MKRITLIFEEDKMDVPLIPLIAAADEVHIETLVEDPKGSGKLVSKTDNLRTKTATKSSTGKPHLRPVARARKS